MSDEQTTEHLPADFPREDLPIVFADGVISAAWEAGVLKFYLVRQDPHTAGNGGNKSVVVQQVVMPVGGFVRSVAFLERCAKRMVSQGLISQEQYDAAFASEG